jgi:hypothetical protein
MVLPDVADTDSLNAEALARRDSSRSGFTKRNGTASPHFTLWTSSKFFAGQNVMSGCNYGARSGDMRDGLQMKGHEDIGGVKATAEVYDEYIRLMRQRKYVEAETLPVPGKKTRKQVFFHTEAMPDSALEEIIDREGHGVYSEAVKKTLRAIHKLTKTCYGGHAPRDTSHKRGLRPCKARSNKKRKLPAVIEITSSSDDESTSSSSSSSSSDEEDDVSHKAPPSPPPKTPPTYRCESSDEDDLPEIPQLTARDNSVS